MINIDSSTIEIIIPDKNSKESTYVFDCLFGEFLGFNYFISRTTESKDYCIRYLGKEVFIANHFFAADFDDLYCISNIPSSINQGKITIGQVEFSLASIYGRTELKEMKSGYYLESDIIGSTFFMFSRWEESVVLHRDVHNRFKAEDSLAYKSNVLHRPIVNEYVDVTEALLRAIGYDEPRKERNYTIVPTHDVDAAYMWTNKISKIRSLGFSTIKEPSISETRFKLKSMVQNRDPYDTYDYLMNLADAAGVKSHFFFMSGGDNEYDANYNIEDEHVLGIIKDVLNRKHLIGIHPSYDSYNDESIFKQELDSLQTQCASSILTGRQHYLRFSIPRTWQIWNECGMAWDSTLGYSSASGFRCGVCYTFPTFDIENRKQLRLREKPLLVMDVTLRQHENLSVESSINRVQKIQQQVLRHNGEFVFLWHNSSFGTDIWKDYTPVLEQLYKRPAKKN